MAEGDSAFLWETEALRSAAPRPVPPPRKEVGDWVTLREAEERTGTPISTLRKWARRKHVPTYLADTPDGQLRMVSLRAVEERRERLGGDQPAPRGEPTSPPAPEHVAVPVSEPSVEHEPPPGTMLVPIDAWDKMLMQLGNLHEAGQQLAEARERAAKAETEAKFLRERLSELRSDLAEARTAPKPEPVVETAAPEPVVPAPEPISHIPIESDEDPEPEAEVEVEVEVDDAEIPVRDLGRTPITERQPHDDELTLAEYSLEMMKHIYSTWRGRPRRDR